jgi:ABC-type multidrug transport system ATPase subunit
MKIKLSQAGKRFNREWIFRKAQLEFSTGTSYAITGPNGSGKSTLLQSLAGMLQLSEGEIEYSESEAPVPPEQAYRYISFCAPYMDVIEEMSLQELLSFHNQFKSFIKGFDAAKLIDRVQLSHAAQKQIRYYSSGMKQRVRLAQAILSDTPVVLLDEPCSNLDAAGIELYHSLISDYCSNRLVIVSSNDQVEYSFCNEVISISSFKQEAFRNQAL